MHWKIENSKMSNYFFCLLLSWKKLKKLEINFSDSLRMYAVTKYYFINIFQNYWFVEWRTQLYEMNELYENAYEYMNRDSQSKSIPIKAPSNCKLTVAFGDQLLQICMCSNWLHPNWDLTDTQNNNNYNNIDHYWKFLLLLGNYWMCKEFISLFVKLYIKYKKKIFIHIMLALNSILYKEKRHNSFSAK